MLVVSVIGANHQLSAQIVQWSRDFLVTVIVLLSVANKVCLFCCCWIEVCCTMLSSQLVGGCKLAMHRVRPLSSSPLRVRPYLMPCSPPHFSSSTPSSRVCPLIEWYPDELICDEGTSRMCQMSRQRRPFWISAIAWNLLGNWVDGIN